MKNPTLTQIRKSVEASRIAYDDLLAAFDKSVYTPQAMARRNMFKRARDKYNG